MSGFSVLRHAAGPVTVVARPARSVRAPELRTVSRSESALGSVELFRQAAAEPSGPLDPLVSEQLRRVTSSNFAHVRVHSGRASQAAAERIGARAYTLGSDIHLGADAAGLSHQDRSALLTHEAVHTVQQGMHRVEPSAALRLSSPADSAEREAARTAVAVSPSARLEHGSPALAQRERLRAESSRGSIAASVSPHIQRDLIGKKAVKDGTFDLNLKTESHPGAKSGMSGTIEFTPDKAAPDSGNIRMLQVVRTQELTGADYVWSGAEARRNTMQTAAAKGVSPGFFVDHSAAAATPRTAKTDAPVSPYYRDYWPNVSVSHDGKKQGATIKSASLWDFPGGGSGPFSFETTARGADTGYDYASLKWGFTITDEAKGKVEHEHADAQRGPSPTFREAIRQFDKAYKNPGASTAP